jgi:hypothetical protein
MNTEKSETTSRAGGMMKPPRSGQKSLIGNTNLKLMLSIHAQLTPLYTKGGQGGFIATILKSP